MLVGQVVNHLKHQQAQQVFNIVSFQWIIKSIQNEAGMNRQAFVRIQVVATGEVSQHLTRDLIEGCNIKVTGFINRHESRNGNPLLYYMLNKLK